MDDTSLRLPILKQYLQYCYGELIYNEDIHDCPESSQMRSDWSCIPLLALKNVLGYLDRQDALAAMSTCRHWRTALLMYEDSRSTLKLRVNDIERSMFLTRLFRRQTTKLIVLVNTCDDSQLDKFMNAIISLFYDTKLQELVFVANNYLHQSSRAPVPQLPRATVEGLMLHLRCLKRFTLIGCKLSSAKNKVLHIKNKEMTKTHRARKFKSHPSPCDSVLSRCNTDLMMYSSIQAMVLDYGFINTESLETLSELKMFRWLTMVIRDKQQFALEPVDWLRLQKVYASPLNVTVCMVQLSNAKIEEVMDSVFVQGLKLVSFKALFCKMMHMDAIVQVSTMYQSSLQEFVWADAPYDITENSQRSLKPVRVPEVMPELNMCNINPLILMCWQCTRLKRIVIHGYWVWVYDVIGMARLRRGLRLELSAASRARSGRPVVRVVVRDPRAAISLAALKQLSENEEGLVDWRPVPSTHLHPALQAGSTREQRADYVLLETRTPYGVT